MRLWHTALAAVLLAGCGETRTAAAPAAVRSAPAACRTDSLRAAAASAHVQLTHRAVDPARLRSQGLPAGPTDVRTVTEAATCRAVLDGFNRGAPPRDSLRRLNTALVLRVRGTADGTVVFVLVHERAEMYTYLNRDFRVLFTAVAVD